MSFVGRHPVLSYLVLAFAIFWVSWLPVLLLDAPPRPFSAVGAILGLALPAFLVTAATDGRAGVRDLLRRTLRCESVSAGLCSRSSRFQSGHFSSRPCFSARPPLERLPQNWTLLFTEFLPQLLLALVTVQFFEELGWAGFVQHRLQSRHGALKASLLVALAFAFLHLPTYLSAPVSGESALRDLSVMAIVIPFAICFRILITFAYNRTGFSVLIAAITHSSFNEAFEVIGPNVPGPLAQVLAFASVGLLALLAAVVSKGTLAYNRDHSPAAHQVA